ncbi:hypothetical protein HDU96_006475 [Phlyctochytrium bullatum]|nr:hypothetical protein HDU96_006475 [Phlyctochytrium bullatum]
MRIDLSQLPTNALVNPLGGLVPIPVHPAPHTDDALHPSHPRPADHKPHTNATLLDPLAGMTPLADTPVVSSLHPNSPPRHVNEVISPLAGMAPLADSPASSNGVHVKFKEPVEKNEDEAAQLHGFHLTFGLLKQGEQKGKHVHGHPAITV